MPHTHSDCSHCITPQPCSRTLHMLLSHSGSLQHHHHYTMHTRRRPSHTRKTLLGSLSRSIHTLTPARITRSQLSINHASTLDKDEGRRPPSLDYSAQQGRQAIPQQERRRIALHRITYITSTGTLVVQLLLGKGSTNT